jgi:acetoin utilization protein AcuC
LSDSVALVTVEDIARAYDFGSSHPLRPERVLLTYAAVRELGFTARDNVGEVPSRDAAVEEIEAVHDPAFVKTVRGIDSGAIAKIEGLPFGLGTPDDPIFPNMHAASAAVAGASLRAAELVASGEFDHAFNPAGGLHHARRSEASGFCIYNDPAVAIAKVLAMHPGWRVVYVDVDVHHGDGVQWLFYDDTRVLTISLHQSGRYLYPGTGFEDELGEGDAHGTSANIPLEPFTGNDEYLWALGELVPRLVRAFKPDLMVTQLGADTHYGDPLANLGLTLAAYPKMAALLHEVAHEVCGGRLVATGGGGYQYDSIVPKVWAVHFAELCGAPDAIPPALLDDRDPRDVARSHASQIERSVDFVLGACEPALERLAGAA